MGYSGNISETGKYLTDNSRTIVYKVNKHQYEEIFDFYVALGLTEDICKKLCNNVFGHSVVPDNSTEYSDLWEFDWTYSTPSYTGSYSRGCYNSSSGYTSTNSSYGGYYNASYGYAYTPTVDVSSGLPERNHNFSSDAKTSSEITESVALEKPQEFFAANVNRASWAYVRNRVKNKEFIDERIVRVEEIINSYHFDLQAPKDNDFEATFEIEECPWNEEKNLLFVGIKGEELNSQVEHNLSFLIDVSESMTSRWILVQMTLVAIICKLGERDKISIIAYSDKTTTVVKNLSCANKEKCINKVLSIVGIGGSTNGSKGLEDAYAYLKSNFSEKKNNRVVIFTDGDFNFGIQTEQGLTEFIQEKSKSGVYLSVVGYGISNFKDNNMEVLAKNGNGNYCLITNPTDISDFIKNEMTSRLITLAKDVKISVDFNPANITEYRLIGYELRQLTRKEFTNDSTITDSVGYGHEVVALFEVCRGSQTELQSASKYVKNHVNVSETSDEYGCLTIKYKDRSGNSQEFSRVISTAIDQNTSDNCNIAAVLALFGMIVRNSEYLNNADIGTLDNLIQKLVAKNAGLKQTEHINVILQYIKNRKLFGN